MVENRSRANESSSTCPLSPSLTRTAGLPALPVCCRLRYRRQRAARLLLPSHPKASRSDEWQNISFTVSEFKRFIWHDSEEARLLTTKQLQEEQLFYYKSSSYQVLHSHSYQPFFSISINLFYFSIEQGLLQKKFQLKSIWCFSLDLLLFFFLLFIFSQSLSVSLSFRAKINCHRKMSLLNIFNHFE